MSKISIVNKKNIPLQAQNLQPLYFNSILLEIIEKLFIF